MSHTPNASLPFPEYPSVLARLHCAALHTRPLLPPPPHTLATAPTHTLMTLCSSLVPAAATPPLLLPRALQLAPCALKLVLTCSLGAIVFVLSLFFVLYLHCVYKSGVYLRPLNQQPHCTPPHPLFLLCHNLLLFHSCCVLSVRATLTCRIWGFDCFSPRHWCDLAPVPTAVSWSVCVCICSAAKGAGWSRGEVRGRVGVGGLG